MQAEWPTVFYEVTNYGLQLALHNGRHIRPRLEEIFEVGRGENQHLPCTIHSIEVIAFTRPGHLCPVLEVSMFLLWFLSEEVVGQANRELAVLVKFVHHSIVVRVVLETTACIDCASDAEAIQFSEEKSRRVELVFSR